MGAGGPGSDGAPPVSGHAPAGGNASPRPDAAAASPAPEHTTASPLSFLEAELREPGPLAEGALPLSLAGAAGPLPGAAKLPPPPAAELGGIVGGDDSAPSPGEVLARLSADPRMTWWARRALAAVVAGVAVTVLADWRLGITAATVIAIADTIFRARTSPVVPARVTAAQRKTRRRLQRLAPSGYLSLHNRLIPGTTAVIDHLVVGPAGVFAVDSERWDRRLPVRATHSGLLFHGPYPQADRLAEARWEAAQAAGLIGADLGEPVKVQPAMVIYGPSVPWTVVRLAGVDVFSGRRLRKYLRREATANRTRRLDDRQVELACAAAARVLPPAC